MTPARTCLLLAAAAAMTLPAAAQSMPMKHHAHMTYHRNVAWPDPFGEADAMQTIAPFEQMKRNGWRSHNTVGTPLFVDGGVKLSPAGHQRVGWIATQAPVERRQIYVAAGVTEEATNQRVAAVNRAVANLQTDSPGPAVYVTYAGTATSPGALVTKINRDRFANMPPPILPQADGGGGLAE